MHRHRGIETITYMLDGDVTHRPLRPARGGADVRAAHPSRPHRHRHPLRRRRGPAETRWPGTRAGEPSPQVKGDPADLARNLANFDDLDVRVYPDGHTTQGIEKPMALADGTTIQPTGKTHRIPMATIGHGFPKYPSIAGGLLAIFTSGPGGISVDARRV
jgi:hypothetical protein